MQILKPSITVLHNPKYLWIFLAFIPVFSFLLFFIPVVLIPGNDLKLQLQLFGWKDYVLILSLAVSESLLLALWLYTLRHAHSAQDKINAVGKGTGGLASGFVAGLFGIKLCPVCLATILGLLGLGTSALPSFLQYRRWIFLTAIAGVIISLHFVARETNSPCLRCITPRDSNHG